MLSVQIVYQISSITDLWGTSMDLSGAVVKCSDLTIILKDV